MRVSEDPEAMPNLVDLIKDRKWDRALFTTYALSLSFFESNILRALREQGCRDVWVLCDADGYRSSLIERRSSRVGIEYHLVPIGMPQGVFHPKCAYLVGPSGDLLTVGSGNLTYGGIGKNLEVFQFVTPDMQPDVFSDFANFLDALATSPTVKIGDRTWQKIFSDRARLISTVPPSTNPVRLVHSLDQPIIEQLTAQLPDSDEIAEIWVLSPFHDPSGKAALQLLQKFPRAMLHVCVPPGAKEFSFPFGKMEAGQVVDAVSMLDEDERQIHAKWITLRGKSAAVSLIGSVNATQAAFCSTKNAEVGLVFRHQDRNVLEQAVGIELPVFVPNEIEKQIGLRSGAVLHASVDTEGRITGSILSGAELRGMLPAWLMLRTGQEHQFQIQIGESGLFSSQLKLPREFFMATGIQMRVEVKGEKIRGWVHNVDLLSLSAAGRIGASVLARFYTAQDTQSDDVEILNYLAESMSDHRDLFDAPITKKEKEEPGPPDAKEEYEVDAFRIRPIEEPETAPGTGPQGRHASSLDRFLARLRLALVADRRRSLTQGQSADGRTNVSAEDEDDDQNRAEEQEDPVAPALRRFESVAEELLRRSGPDIRAKRQVLTMLFEVGVKFRLHRGAEAAILSNFVANWYRLALLPKSLGSEVSAYEQYICIVIVWIAQQSIAKGQRRIHSAKSDFERLFGGEPDQARCSKAVKSALELPLVKEILGVASDQMDQTFKEILASESERAQLARAYSAWKVGNSVPSDIPILKCPDASALREAFSRKPSAHFPAIYGVSVTEEACPKCNMALGIYELNCLAHRRYCKCVYCGRVLVASEVDD
jgi:hypothetical protein